MRNTQMARQAFENGQPPKGWQIVPVGDVLVSAQYGTNAASKREGNTAIVGMKDIQEGKIFSNDLAQADLPDKEREKYLLDAGDILFNRTNSYELVGKVGIFNDKTPAAFASYLVRLIVNKSRILPTYLNYYLNGHIAQKAVKRIATRAVGQANVNPTELKRHCFVHVPPLPEQKKIVEILGVVEHAIDLTDRLIETEQELRKGLIQLLLTGKRRLPGFSSPWKTMRLGEIFKNRVESNRIELPLLAITGDKGVIPRDQVERKDSSNADKSRYLRICPGDIGYNTMRMWQGVSALSKLEGVVSPAYTIVIPNMDVDGEFMTLFFKFPPTIHLFFRYSQGLVSDTLNLKYNNFAKIQVSVPEKREQKAIIKIFRKLDDEIDLLKKILDSIREQKKGLMQQLLTGKVRVKIPETETG